MREILFKAKRIDNGEWVEGGIYIGNYAWIVTTDKDGKFVHCMVDKTTICQYTGLTDKNGVKIWENDVVCYGEFDRFTKKTTKYYGIVKYGRRAENFKLELGFNLEWLNINYFRCDICYWTENREIEVIGNIFDNPELLEVVE